jgi:hypothetical protein
VAGCGGFFTGSRLFGTTALVRADVEAECFFDDLEGADFFGIAGLSEIDGRIARRAHVLRDPPTKKRRDVAAIPQTLCAFFIRSAIHESDCDSH